MDQGWKRKVKITLPTHNKKKTGILSNGYQNYTVMKIDPFFFFFFSFSLLLHRVFFVCHVQKMYTIQLKLLIFNETHLNFIIFFCTLRFVECIKLLRVQYSHRCGVVSCCCVFFFVVLAFAMECVKGCEMKSKVATSHTAKRFAPLLLNCSSQRERQMLTMKNAENKSQREETERKNYVKKPKSTSVELICVILS